jgi:WD40 repeat protein
MATMKSNIIYMNHLLSISLFLALLLGANSWCTKHYFTVPANPNIMEISPDNSYMAITSTASNKVYVYDLYNFNRLLEYTPSSGTVVTAKFSTDGNYLAIALNNKNIIFLSGGLTFNHTIKTTLSTSQFINDIDFSPNGNNRLLVCYTNNAYDIYSNYLNSTSNTYRSFTPAAPQIKKCKFTKNDSVALIDSAGALKIAGSGGTLTTTCTGTIYSILDVRLTTGAI